MKKLLINGKKELSGNSSFSFNQQLMNMSDIIKKNWAIVGTFPKLGSITVSYTHLRAHET